MNELIGRQFDNYRIDALLGEGGMGAVYQATDLNLKRTVAVKFMSRGLVGEQEFRQRFLQEAQSAARLNHPSIVTIHDFKASQRWLYMVMAYVGGGSLSKFIHRLGQTGEVIRLREVMALLAQVADALAYAHKQGIIHRDIKPSNVLLERLEAPEREGDPPLRAIVTDFGLAKMLEGGLQTQTGRLMGTYAYMSPEQCLREPLDGRSDIYSLGVMLYQLTTGVLPFDIQSATDAVLTHQKGESPPAPRQVRPGLSPIPEVIIHRAIARKPEDRFKDAGIMALALREGAGKLTDAEITRFSSERTVLSLETHLQEEDAVSKPSRMGFDLSVLGFVDRLVIAQKEHTPRTVNLEKDRYTLGSGQENDIVLEDRTVSRQHARIERTAEGWQVVDTGSTNGTFLEGTQLLMHIPESWAPRQTLRIGPYFLHWQQASTQRTQPEGMIPTLSSLGSIGIRFLQPNAEVAPGSRADFQVEVFNQGSVVDHFTLHVEELPPSWVKIPEDTVFLMIRESGVLNFSIHPPQDSSARAGEHPFRLVVSSTDNPQDTTTASGQVTVTPFERFSIDMQPSNLASGGTSRVTIRNQGNTDGMYSIVGRDPAEAIRFEGEKGRIKIEPGQTETLALRVVAKKRPFLGSSKTRSFEVQVNTATGSPQKRTGQLNVRPVLPGWILLLLGLLLVVCPIAGGFAYNEFNKRNAQATQVALAGTESALADKGTADALALTLTADVRAASQTADAISANRTATAEEQKARRTEEAFAANRTATVEALILKGTADERVARETAAKQTADVLAENRTATADAQAANRTATAEALILKQTADERAARQAAESLAETQTAEALAARGGGSGWIAFTSDRNGDKDIYVVNINDGQLINLTNNSADDLEPAWSPDGSKIAFSSNRDSGFQIYVMNFNGGGIKKLTSVPDFDGGPAWSPNGSKIAFFSGRQLSYEIYLMNPDGSGQTQITEERLGFSHPAWSPDSSKIAFHSINNHGSVSGLTIQNSEIFLINTTGSGLTQLTSNPTNRNFLPAWSPDGSKIAFVTNRDGNLEIYIMNPNGSGQINWTNNPADDWYPAWSPDGSKIAFSSDRDGDEEIYVMNASGTGLIQLTDNRSQDSEPDWQP